MEICEQRFCVRHIANWITFSEHYVYGISYNIVVYLQTESSNSFRGQWINGNSDAMRPSTTTNAILLNGRQLLAPTI